MLVTGRTTAIGIGIESTAGTAVSRSNWAKPLAIDGGFEVQEYAPIETLRQGVGWGIGAKTEGNVTVSGTIRMPLLFAGSGMWLRWAIGAPSTSGSDPYAHVYAPSYAPSTATLEAIRGTSGKSELLVGAIATGFTLSTDQGGLLILEIPFLAFKANADRDTAPSPAFTSWLQAAIESGRIPSHRVGSVGWNSATYPIHRSFSLSVDRQVEAHYAIGSRYAVDYTVGHGTAMIEVGRIESGDALYNAHRAGTQSDLTVAITGLGDYAGLLTLRNALVSAHSSPLTAPGALQESVTWMGLGDDSDAAFEVSLTNNQSSGTAN